MSKYHHQPQDAQARMTIKQAYLDCMAESRAALTDIERPTDPSWSHPEWFAGRLEMFSVDRVEVFFPVLAYVERHIRDDLARIMRTEKLPLTNVVEWQRSLRRQPDKTEFLMANDREGVTLAARHGLVSVRAQMLHSGVRLQYPLHTLDPLLARLRDLGCPYDAIAKLDDGQIVDRVRWRPEVSQQRMPHVERQHLSAYIREIPTLDHEHLNAQVQKHMIDDCFASLDQNAA